MFDLPPPPPLIVTEHRAHTCQCHHCGAQTRAAFPEDVTSPAQYGDGIAALAAYFQTLHCIPEKRLAQLILDTYGIKISAATLAKLIAKKAKEINPFAEAVNDQLSGEQTAVKHSGRDRVKGCRQNALESRAVLHFPEPFSARSVTW